MKLFHRRRTNSTLRSVVTGSLREPSLEQSISPGSLARRTWPLSVQEGLRRTEVHEGIFGALPVGMKSKEIVINIYRMEWPNVGHPGEKLVRVFQEDSRINSIFRKKLNIRNFYDRILLNCLQRWKRAIFVSSDFEFFCEFGLVDLTCENLEL